MSYEHPDEDAPAPFGANESYFDMARRLLPRILGSQGDRAGELSKILMERDVRLRTKIMKLRLTIRELKAEKKLDAKRTT